jgi:hypothetical protein
VLGGRHSGRAANRPTLAGEPRSKRPRNRAGSLARWVFGESQVLLRRAIVAVSRVMGRDGHGRHDFGCWVARVSAGALQPESDSECPLSLQHAVGRVVAPQGVGIARITRIVSRGLAPLAGKGRASARAATGDGSRLRLNVPSRSVQVSRYGLPSASVGGASSRLPRFSTPPCKGV